MSHYFIRIGVQAEIRRAKALAAVSRGRRVVVRSPRGIEIAEILSPCDASELSFSQEPAAAFRILRPVTANDERLVERLERYKRDAVELCRRRLKESGSATTLLDVDQMLDGGTLVMHFLGAADSIAESIAGEVAKQYESVVRTNHLSELLTEGCGPGCGDSVGCGDAGGGCAGCSGCGSR